MAKPAAQGGIEANGLRRVRLLEKEAKLIEIRNTRVGYKALKPGENHHVQIFELSNGRWKGEAVTVFEANQRAHEPSWANDYPNARFIMRLYKGDLLRLNHNGKERIMKVGTLETENNRVRLAEHMEGGELDKRHKAPEAEDPFRWAMISFNQLKVRSARKICVDEIGRVRDPGPPA